MRGLVIALGLLLAVGCNTEALESEIAGLQEEKGELDKQLQSLRGENARLARKLEAAEKSLEKAKAAEAEKAAANAQEGAKKIREALGLKDGQKLYATFKTSMGDIVAELFIDQTPITVENFVRLAEGTKEWKDPKTGKMVKRPLYKGTVFHRVIPGFMIEGGDPLGNGTGGPGYNFQDEFVPGLKHSTGGILSMANRGPGTNGSQFFLTEVPTPHLDNKHTVFGKVVENLELVKTITHVEKMTSNPRDARPKTPITLKDVLIGRGAAKK